MNQIIKAIIHPIRSWREHKEYWADHWAEFEWLKDYHKRMTEDERKAEEESIKYAAKLLSIKTKERPSPEKDLINSIRELASTNRK